MTKCPSWLSTSGELVCVFKSVSQTKPEVDRPGAWLTTKTDDGSDSNIPILCKKIYSACKLCYKLKCFVFIFYRLQNGCKPVIGCYWSCDQFASLCYFTKSVAPSSGLWLAHQTRQKSLVRINKTLFSELESSTQKCVFVTSPSPLPLAAGFGWLTKPGKKLWSESTKHRPVC